MISILLLFAGVLGGVSLLTLLYFLAVHAVDEVAPESLSSGSADPDAALFTGGAGDGRALGAKRAVIHCAAYPPLVPYRYKTAGYTDCNVLNTVYGGNLSCTNGCLGLGSCANVCPNDSIQFRYGEVYVSETCDGCGKCIRSCPKKLIELVASGELRSVSCAASGNNDSSSLCPVALDQHPYEIDYRNFSRSGFKILHK